MARGMTTTNRAAYPWRDVTSVERWQTGNHAHNAWTLSLTLSCGHIRRRKASQGEPARVRCTQCPAINAAVAGRR